MSFNIFGSATKDSIRVGYVDPDRGYLTGKSIYEANVHASKNPGAVFILETRDRVRYLTINEVNRLTTNDITPDQVSCEDGIKGLRPGETAAYPNGSQPIIVSGSNEGRSGTNDSLTGRRLPRSRSVKVGASGGTSLTVGGRGGKPISAGGKYLRVGGRKVKSGGSGGTPIFLGGAGGTPVLVDSQPLTINGKGVFAGGNGGSPITSGGRGGQKLKTDGAPNAGESKIYISGGGGVGAFAVPVIGSDGSVLAAIVTEGGYGYKTPPQSRLYDSLRRGVGTVLKTYLGTAKSTTIFYDQEDDFEVYDLTPPFTLSGYGKRFGPDGEELGDWDPNLFASLQEDPISLQIRDYQDFLKQLENPWWHTRKETPLEVIFRDKTDQVKHDVKHWAWGGKLVEIKQPPTKNNQLEELEFEVYTQGGNQVDRDLQFTFTSEDGGHKFQFKAPEFKENRKTKVKRKVKRNTVYTVVASGKYKGKGVEQGLVDGFGKSPKEIKGDKKGTVIFADFVESANDNDDLQIRATQGKFTASNERKRDGHSINDLTYKFESGKDFIPSPPKNKNVIEDSFMNRYAISPTPPSNVPGTDYAGRVATFVWEEDFPHDGEYKFRGMADNIGKIYIDNELVMEERKFKGDPVKVISRYIEKGVHEIKVELFNIPIKEKPKPKPQNLTITYHGLNKGITKLVSGERKYPIEFDGLNRANNPIEVSGNNSRNQNNTLKLRDGHGIDSNAKFTILSSSPGVSAKFSDNGRELKVKGSGDVTIRLSWDDNPRTAGVAVKSIKVAGKTWRQKGEKGNQTETIKVGAKETKEVIGKGGFIVSGNKRQIKMRDGHGDDINSTFSIASSTNNARFSDDGKRLITSGPGNIQLKLEWDDNPKTYGAAVDKIEVGGVVLDQRGEKGSTTKILTINAPKTVSNSNQSQKYESIFNTADFINKADRKLWRTNVYGRGGFLSENGVCPFDTKKPLDDNPYAGTHVIRWEHVDFPYDGNYDITVDVDDNAKIFIGNRIGDGAMMIGNGLKDVEVGGDEVIIENGMKKQTYTRFFKKGKYRIRTELTQTPGGVFSFDKNGRAGGPDVTARFIERGGKNFLKVEGSGSAKIHFRLRTDDNPGISGVFASKIKIGLPPNDFVELKRGQNGRRLKEKETINGSAFFEAGREYPIQTINSNRDTGSIIKNKGQTIEYDDDISNGFDENADLTITKITDQQKPKVKGINPMALAIDIKTKEPEQPRISARSWQENPMGAAFTIEAPLPPIPQEPPLEQEGRCPNNPLWSSRFAGGSESWWPVTHPAWSKFTNRFAMSPLPPLSLPNSDGGGGVVYSSTWQVNFPYNGFYGFKGTGDNKGRILIDGQEVYKLRGFKNTSPDIVKRKITEGNHEVTLEIENQDQRKRKKVKKEFFNTQKWQAPIKEGPPNPAEILVEYRGLNRGSTRLVSSEKIYPITFEDLNPSNRRIEVSGNNVRHDNNTLKLRDGSGIDANVKFTIISTSPGVSAKFSNDGRKLLTKGRGDVTIRLEYDDNPNIAGEAVRSITINGTKWRKQRKEKGSDTETIKVGGVEKREVIGKGGYTVSGNSVKMRDGHGDDINSTFSIVSSTVDAKFSSDGKKINYKGSGEITLRLKWDDNPNAYGVAVDSIAVGGKVWNQRGEKNSKTQTIKVTAESSATGGVQSGKSIDGVTYTGPDLFNFKHPAWSELMNKISVSPYTPPLDIDNPDINGLFTLKWSGVKFTENGRYDLAFQADNIAKLFIGGKEVQEVRSFRGEPRKSYIELSRGTYDVEVQLTNVPNPRDIFNSNPSGVALKITKDVTIVSSESPPWTTNPVGASAMIIPPPCPKEVEGTGFVEEIEVLEPGNGHPPPEFPEGGGTGIPVTLQLVDIIPTATGIGYTPGDRIILEVPDRPPIEFIPELDPFGRIIGIPTPGRPEIPPPGPGTDDETSGFDIIGNSETQILQVRDLPGEIGVADDTGVLIPLIPSGGGASGQTVVPAPGPYYGFTEYPNIYPTSNTGLGFRGRPVFKAVVIPENILPDESVLQVVDIPGIRKTGYVNGKPYYGQVFAKDGNLFAGISETIGQLVPVYATLQESILNRQTIEPSAILRSGTETNSNNPTLNIPNTPDNLI